MLDANRLKNILLIKRELEALQKQSAGLVLLATRRKLEAVGKCRD